MSHSADESIETIKFNISDFTVFRVSEDTEVTASLADPVYEQFITDVWVGIVLTLLVLSCVCFMCSCLVYHKFQEWKHRALRDGRSSIDLESGTLESDLPTYTIASGLPTYEEALEQLKKVKELQQIEKCDSKPQQGILHQQQQEQQQQINAEQCVNSLSVFNLFGIYNKEMVDEEFRDTKMSYY